jgi:hypothetical protein
LLETGVDVDETAHFRLTPLHSMLSRSWLFRKADLEMVRLLVEHGAELNSPVGRCPFLPFALLHADDSLTSYLLESGADFRRKDLSGNTLLHDALPSDGSTTSTTSFANWENWVSIQKPKIGPVGRLYTARSLRLGPSYCRY